MKLNSNPIDSIDITSENMKKSSNCFKIPLKFASIIFVLSKLGAFSINLRPKTFRIVHEFEYLFNKFHD